MRSKLLSLIAAGLLAGCATPGAPQPPSLQLPRPAEDLEATRQADRVTLTWSAPELNTDRTRIQHRGVTRVCRAIDTVVMGECRETAGELQPQQIPPSGRATFTDVLPPALQRQHPRGFATYAIETLNTRGRSAGLGNRVQVLLAPTLPPPQALLAELTAQGVVISWVVPLDEIQVLESNRPGQLQYRWLLFRRDAAAPHSRPVEVPTANAFASPTLRQPNLNVLDAGIEWEHKYVYWAQVQTVVPGEDNKPPTTIAGNDSPPLEVATHDTFPPATPSGLQAAFSGLEQQKFIDLIWEPDTESDLAGYNVYRHEEGTSPVKLNSELVKPSAYRDSNIQSGHKYFYSVSAVDVRGNESPRSPEASEAVP